MTDKNGRFEGHWGLKAIARRMSCSVDQLRRLHDQQGFFMLLLMNPNRKHPHNFSSRWIWYTNEQLISAWYFSQMNKQREMRKKYGGRWWAKKHGVI